MTTSITQENGTAPAPPLGNQPKSTKKARVAPPRAHVTPTRAKATKKASSKKKAPKRPLKPTSNHKAAVAGKDTKGRIVRTGTKTEKVLDLLKREGGATLKDLMKATGWQSHSVRGFVSGTLGKKMGLTVESTKRDDGERFYKIVN
jgi:hypothetical protein